MFINDPRILNIIFVLPMAKLVGINNKKIENFNFRRNFSFYAEPHPNSSELRSLRCANSLNFSTTESTDCSPWTLLSRVRTFTVVFNFSFSPTTENKGYFLKTLSSSQLPTSALMAQLKQRRTTESNIQSSNPAG